MSGSTIDVRALAKGERNVLAKAITMAESSRDEDRRAAEQALEKIMAAAESKQHSEVSMRIGISGTPGVGKSTFIEAFGLHLLKKRRRVAVLAVDPSSPVSGGSVLGDKTRMGELSRRRGVFIRPSPSSGALGGVSLCTREAILLCEAAGYNTVLVETMGVGQAEHKVADVVDFFLLLVQPDTGDELQGIKRGILELADAVIINKADGAYRAVAQRDQARFASALHLARTHTDAPQVLLCSAKEGEGIAAIWELVRKHHRKTLRSGKLAAWRGAQNQAWLQRLLEDMLHKSLRDSPAANALHRQLEAEVTAGRLSPYRAAQRIFSAGFPSS